MSDASLPRPARRLMRPAMTDSVRNDLLDLRRVFRNLHDVGDFAAYRFQYAPLPMLPGPVKELVESLRGVIGTRQNERDTHSGSLSHALATYCYFPPPELDQAAGAAFDRLRRELGFDRIYGAYYRGFPPVIRFLIGFLLPFPPPRVRCVVRRFVPSQVALDDDLQFAFGTCIDISPHFRYVEVGTLRYADDETTEPLFFVTEIDNICFAVCEALDALLDGRLSQRPIVSPFTADPFAVDPPNEEDIRRFQKRWGREVDAGHFALSHVLRCFYEPDAGSSTVSGTEPPETPTESAERRAVRPPAAKPHGVPSGRRSRRKSGAGRPAKYDEAFIAALSTHHGYGNSRCETFEPISNAKMREAAEGCSDRALSDFWKRTFPAIRGLPRKRYEIACARETPLLGALVRLNRELPSFEAMGIDLDRLPDDD